MSVPLPTQPGAAVRVLLIEGDGPRLAPGELADSESVAALERHPPDAPPADPDRFDVVLLHVPSAKAAEWVAAVRERLAALPLVVLCDGGGDGSAVVEAVRHGAEDFLVRERTDPPTLALSLKFAVERKRARDALQKSEAFYHSLVESLPQNIFRKDLSGRFTFGNARFCAEMGRQPADVIGRTDFDFFPPDLADKYRADDRRVVETGRRIDTVEEHRTPTGETLFVQVIKTPVYDAAGTLIGTQGIFWDVTEKFRAEERLRTANRELADKEAELLATMDLLKQSHEELIQAQLQLIQAEKMESIGRLAAGVAHEVKNPLAILLMGLDYLRDAGRRDAEADKEVLRAMRDAVGRADAIVRGLVDFSAARQLDATPHDLGALIRQSCVLVKHEMTQAHVIPVMELDPDLPPVLLDATKIQQVFVNLFMNAVHAMPDGGTLRVRTFPDTLLSADRGFSSRSAERFRPGDPVVVAQVDDTGGGIPQDKLASVFDPFFTTKPTGRGTGLGLTVTRKIVELHHAAITIQNRPEGGVRVTLTFKPYGSQTHADAPTRTPDRPEGRPHPPPRTGD